MLALLLKASSAAPVLAAATGTFAATGVAAGAAEGLPVAAGTFAATGVAATFRTTHVLAAAPGAFARTGVAAAFARAMPAAPTAYAATGLAATLSRAPAPLGTYDFNGNQMVAFAGMAVTNGSTNDTFINAPFAGASFAWAGGTDVPLVGHRLGAVRGVFAVAGVSASAGTLDLYNQPLAAFAGRAVVNNANSVRLAASPGSVALAGVVVPLKESHRLVAAAGAITLGSPTTPLVRGRAVVGATGAFAWQGVASGRLRGLRFAMVPGSLALAGKAATLTPAARPSGTYDWWGNQLATVANVPVTNHSTLGTGNALYYRRYILGRRSPLSGRRVRS